MKTLRFTKPLLTALCLLSALNLTLQAQSNQQPHTNLRFLFLDESPGLYYLKVDEDFQNLSTRPYAISKPIKARASDEIEIYKEFPDQLTESGKAIRIKVTTVSPPINTVSSLAVIAPRPSKFPESTIPSYATRFYNSNPEEFPPKSIRILNLNNNPVVAQFGEQRVAIAAGGEEIIEPDTDTRNRLIYKIATRNNEDDWKLRYNNMMIIRPEERITGILVYSPSGMRHTYTEAELRDLGEPEPGIFWLTYTD
ncbi:MAG TPA: hypothetical protein DEA90_05215 [Opitutae bacterium]|nr:hypothetical protein [Puniceicoccaceae bacterium]HBR93546.1 hypothetical protein [Opitutae bacterium]|tara:strand:- start:33 stop:791 length:759 start_codon:yes stop_codon:yes gene_type:complete